MTPGNNGASTPEDDDPFGYLYADGQANGAQPPSGGYGYPNSVSRVRTVGDRPRGQQHATYGQGVPPQQGAYGARPHAHYAAPENYPGGAPTTQQPVPGSGGGRRGPNTKGLLIGAVAVVAAVVIGIGVAMVSSNSDDDAAGGDASPTPTATESTEPTPTSSATGAASEKELPAIDAKTLQLGGGATTASDIKGAKADGGFYVTGFNTVGASVTWKVDGIPESGKYTLYVGYGVPGKDQNATLTVNGTPQTRKVNLANFAHAPEGDYEKGWTETYNYIQLNKGTNELKISCEQGNQCDANLDRLWLVKGWVE
jgi:hypothetical protein